MQSDFCSNLDLQVLNAYNMARIHHDLDFSQIPLSALKQSTMVTLSASLNQYKIIPTNKGLPRDWRGLAQLVGLNGVEASQISGMPDCFSALVNYWGTQGNVLLLQQYLGEIDRYDILDDAKEAFVKDSLEYKDRLTKLNTTVKNVRIEADKNILTVDDVIRLQNGLEPQIYDAYVLYAEEDSDFATELVETMEQKYNFKLCVRDRDLIGGIPFEHDAITKLIAERCRRLVVIISSNFLKSKANKFFVTFAQALGIDSRERKVIPILYERCEVPPELSYYFLLDYNRAGKLWSFWDKLRDSIQAPEVNLLPAPPKNALSATTRDMWISRILFEEKPDEVETKFPASPAIEVKAKRGNIYKIIKNSFNRLKKSSASGQDATERKPEVTGNPSLIDQFTDEDSGVPSENFDDSSSFESRDSSEKNRKVKKKWYKKRAVETLLT